MGRAPSSEVRPWQVEMRILPKHTAFVQPYCPPPPPEIANPLPPAASGQPNTSSTNTKKKNKRRKKNKGTTEFVATEALNDITRHGASWR